MYVLIATWQINGYVSKSQNMFDEFDDLLERVKHFEIMLIGDETMKLINVEIFRVEK